MNNRKSWIRMVASATAALGILGFILYKSDISVAQVGESIARFGWSGIAIVLTVCLLQTLFMILRLFVLFPTLLQPGFVRVAYAVSVGQLINMFFPARAGDVLKVVLLKGGEKTTEEEPGDTNLSALGATGVLLADRIVDFSSLALVIFASGAYRMPGISLPKFEVPRGASAILFGALAISTAGLLWVFRAKLPQFAVWLRELKQGFLGALRPKQIIGALLFSVGSWSCEALAVQTLATYQGLPITFTQSIFVLCVLNLAIAIPVSVANVGPFEASVVFALGSLGASTAQSLAVATVHHGLQLVAILGWALVTTLLKKGFVEYVAKKTA